MYTPRGFGLSEVGDVEVVPAGAEIHLFHLTLPNHDVVQHAVSADGLAWRALPAALRTGDPGDCDDDQIWTASVTPDPAGGYVMLYTALRRDDDGMVQRTGLARSRDLLRWEKAGPEAVAEADPRWYEADPATAGRVSWRDPKPTLVGDTYYAAVCAREKDGPLARRGCVGLMTSTDLNSWEVVAPLFAPRRHWDLECPQLFRLGEPAGDSGPWYLTAAVMEDRSQRYWVADRVDGPYEVPPDGGMLAPAGHYAGRVCRWRGQDLFFCWHRTALTAGWVATPTTVDWLTLRNPYGKFVVPPLALAARPDGTIARRSYAGWDGYRTEEPAPLVPAVKSLYRSRATNGWTVIGDGGMDLVATAESYGDVLVEGTIQFAARAGGFAFRLDEEGGGYFIELGAEATEVSLQKWIVETNPHDGRRGTRYVELQRGRLHRSLPIDTPLRFQLLLVGPYIEFSVDDEVVLAELSAERTSGPIGVWADSGQVLAHEVQFSPMLQPQHG